MTAAPPGAGVPAVGDPDEPEVTIVGAGPVGMTLAALLGSRGRRVRIIDKRAAPVSEPRAVHLDHQAARILDAAGVMAALAARCEAMDAYEWRNAAGEVLLRLQPEQAVGRSGWPESLMFAQPDLEALLDARLAGLPSVELRRGCAVEDLASLGDEGWVVACDGARSTVRSLLGIGLAERGGGGEWLIVDVAEARRRRWVPCNLQVCDPVRPTTAVSGGPGRRRFEFMRLPGEDAAGLASEATAWRLLAPWGLHAGNARLVRHAVYRFGACLAEQWRKGRVLLAGDAAHQMPPFAGQGLCAGLRDAANLAWKLDAVLAGAAPDALLDTYQSERQPQARTEIDFSADLGRIVCVADPAAAAARDREMVAAARRSGPVAPPPLPPLGPGLLLAGDPAAGSLAVQGDLVAGGRHGRFDEVVGRGWVLYGRDGDPARLLAAHAAAWLAGIGGRCADCSDAPAPYPAWFAEARAAVILVRPDFAVYGTARHAVAATELVARLRRRLQAPAGQV